MYNNINTRRYSLSDWVTENRKYVLPGIGAVGGGLVGSQVGAMHDRRQKREGTWAQRNKSALVGAGLGAIAGGGIGYGINKHIESRTGRAINKALDDSTEKHQNLNKEIDSLNKTHKDNLEKLNRSHKRKIDDMDYDLGLDIKDNPQDKWKLRGQHRESVEKLGQQHRENIDRMNKGKDQLLKSIKNKRGAIEQEYASDLLSAHKRGHKSINKSARNLAIGGAILGGGAVAANLNDRTDPRYKKQSRFYSSIFNRGPVPLQIGSATKPLLAGVGALSGGALGAAIGAQRDKSVKREGGWMKRNKAALIGGAVGALGGGALGYHAGSRSAKDYKKGLSSIDADHDKLAQDIHNKHAGKLGDINQKLKYAQASSKGKPSKVVEELKNDLAYHTRKRNVELGDLSKNIKDRKWHTFDNHASNTREMMGQLALVGGGGAAATMGVGALARSGSKKETKNHSLMASFRAKYYTY